MGADRRAALAWVVSYNGYKPCTNIIYNVKQGEIIKKIISMNSPAHRSSMAYVCCNICIFHNITTHVGTFCRYLFIKAKKIKILGYVGWLFRVFTDFIP